MRRSCAAGGQSRPPLRLWAAGGAGPGDARTALGGALVRRCLSLFSWTLRLVVAWASLVVAAPALAQPEIELLGTDAAAGVDRYRVTIMPGDSLWAVATRRLPLTALDEGDGAALALVEESFSREFPGRPSTRLLPGDSFVLEVPAGTFVASTVERLGGEVRYTAFNGDVLSEYPRDPYLLYRLVRAARPGRAEVRLTGASADPVRLAERVFGVSPPDFLQVRWMRQAMASSTTRVAVDLERPYLDEFRNVRERALRVEEGEEGRHVYVFSAAQPDVPFVRVEDALGDEVDPAAFPPHFRVEFLKQGIVKRYLVTQPGDVLAVVRQPQNARWSKVYGGAWTRWREGEPSALEPFAPALTASGRLLPGRILVLTHAPEPPRARETAQCLGVPLVLLAAGLVLARVEPGGRWLRCGPGT